MKLAAAAIAEEGGASCSYSSGCLISETQEPQWRCLTPRNFFFDGTMLALLPPPCRPGRPAGKALQILCQGREGQSRQAGHSRRQSGGNRASTGH